MALADILNGKSVSDVPKDVWEFMFVCVLHMTPHQIQSMPKQMFDRFAALVDYKFKFDARKGT